MWKCIHYLVKQWNETKTHTKYIWFEDVFKVLIVNNMTSNPKHMYLFMGENRVFNCKLAKWKSMGQSYIGEIVFHILLQSYLKLLTFYNLHWICNHSLLNYVSVSFVYVSKPEINMAARNCNKVYCLRKNGWISWTFYTFLPF